jgi:hypothetical protein
MATLARSTLAAAVGLGLCTVAHAACPLRPQGQPVDLDFGTAAVFTGDLDQDGAPDFAVGAARADAGGEATPGRVYIFFGGAGADATPDLVLQGDAPGDRFGMALGGHRDLDGDGAPDLVVGAPGNDQGAANRGRVYVYFGGPGFDGVPDLVLAGQAAGDAFGRAVAMPGDVSGDGWDDLVVGAPYNSSAGLFTGRIYVYFGGPGLDAVFDRSGSGNLREARGFTLAAAGDANGDGWNDFLAASHESGAQAGRAYAFWGGPTADVQPT